MTNTKSELKNLIKNKCFDKNNNFNGSMVSKLYKKDQKFSDILYSYTSFLPNNVTPYLRAKCILKDITSMPICQQCNSKPVSIFQKREFNKFCSKKCVVSFCNTKERNEKISIKNTQNAKERIKKARKTYKEKTGYDNPAKNPSVKTKMKNTCLEKYGYDNPFNSNEVQEKSRENALKNNNGIHYNSKGEKGYINKTKTCLKKYGVEHYSTLETHKNKMSEYMISIGKEKHQKTIKTLKEKYGVENIMHIPEYVDKAGNQYLWKEYTLPSGKIIKIQGYENFFLDEYLKHNKEHTILTSKKDMPEIWYEEKGIKHRYYPDFFIPSTNTIIEVKSIYTWEKYKTKNILKLNAAKNLGFNVELKVYQPQGHEVIESVHH